MTEKDDKPDTAAELAALRTRVDRIENLISARRIGTDVDQVERDKALMFRYPNTREEAVAQADARRRLADAGLIDAHGRVKGAHEEDAANAMPSTPDAASGVTPAGAPLGPVTGAAAGAVQGVQVAGGGQGETPGVDTGGAASKGTTAPAGSKTGASGSRSSGTSGSKTAGK